MKEIRTLLAFIVLIVTTSLACRAVTGSDLNLESDSNGEAEVTLAPADTPTPLPPIPVKPGEANPDEPVVILGKIPYTSPFFVNSLSEPFVMLEDETGFIKRDREFEFNLVGQIIGPVELQPDQTLTYQIALPSIPQGNLEDLDQDDQQEAGVQVFAIAYWSNTWGDPFLEKRDGQGWSTAYASTITDPENKDEIKGGVLVIWAPDDQQSFPTGFGEDGLLFTEDDPSNPVSAGYSLVDLNAEPFRVWKEARPVIDLNEGVVAVNDYSQMSYTEAFDALFEKASREYPFTEQKSIDWQALHDQFAPRVAQANDKASFYRAIRDFTWQIPDGHVGVSFDPEVFYEEGGGSFGMVLTELTDGSVIVTQVISDTAAARAGIQVGAQLLEWNGKPIHDALDEVNPYFGPYSTESTRRVAQALFLTRVPPGTEVNIRYKNSPTDTAEQDLTLTAEVEYDSLQAALGGGDEVELPIWGEVLDESGLGYIRINTFSDDYNLMARLWDHYIQGMIAQEVPGLIIDIRNNGGGSSGMALNFAGYFYDQEIELTREQYYNEKSEKFEPEELPTKIEPGPAYYTGKVALLVSPNCVSACEGFAYAMTRDERSIVVGHYPSAGAYGEVGRGQYTLPDDLSLQMPTGRSETAEGDVILEGVGVVPDVLVPITRESALGQVDAVLQAAVQELLKNLR